MICLAQLPSQAEEVATPPQNLHLVKVGGLSPTIKLAWDAPVSFGGASYGVLLQGSVDNGVTWYSVDDLSELGVQTKGSEEIEILNYGETADSCKDYIYIQSAKTYQFRIATITETGKTSTFSDSIIVTTPAGKPSPPSYSACAGGISVGSTNGKVPLTATWQKPTDDGGSPILGYNIKYVSCNWNARTETGKITGKYLSLPTLKASQKTLKLPQLTKGKCWAVFVAAYNKRGTGAWQGSGFIVIDNKGQQVYLKQE